MKKSKLLVWSLIVSLFAQSAAWADWSKDELETRKEIATWSATAKTTASRSDAEKDSKEKKVPKRNRASSSEAKKGSPSQAEKASPSQLVSVYFASLLAEDADFVIDDYGTLVEYRGTDSVVIIPETVIEIGSQVFMNNDQIQEIIFSDSVLRVGSQAFAYMENLEKITIGSGMKFAYSDIIEGSPKLETIIVSEQNKEFYVEDGVLYQHDNQDTIWYPMGRKTKDYSIPEGMTYVEFQGNPYLESLYISKDVRSLKLSGLSNLRTITLHTANAYFTVVDGVLYNSEVTQMIYYPPKRAAKDLVVPETVTRLGSDEETMFFENTALRTIYFAGTRPGTVERWKSLFGAGSEIRLYYYNDYSWDSLKWAYENTWENLSFTFDFSPTTKGYEIVAEKEIVLVGEQNRMRVIFNDLSSKTIGEEKKPEYWKVESGKGNVSADGIVTPTVQGEVTVTAGGNGVADKNGKDISSAIHVMDKPENYKEISSTQEWDVLRIVNQERMKNGLAPVGMFDIIQEAANVREEELARFYSHNRPDGTEWYTVLKKLDIKYLVSGENIAYDCATPAKVMNIWMNSPVHYANIMEESVTQLGVGYIRAGQYQSHLWVQLFVGSNEEVLGIYIDQEKDYQVSQGESIDASGMVLVSYCTEYGTSFFPVIDEMCTGYDKYTAGQQTITVHYGEWEEEVSVTVKASSSSGSSSGGGGGGGGSSSGSGGGGGSSTGASGGGVLGGPGSIGTLPDYVVTGTWNIDNAGQWSFVSSSGEQYRNKWAAVYNPYANTALGQQPYDWFRFDENGIMVVGWFADPIDGQIYYLNPVSDNTKGRMLTGWQTIEGKEYYFNPQSDGSRGRMFINENTGDGHFVGADGCKVY